MLFRVLVSGGDIPALARAFGDDAALKNQMNFYGKRRNRCL